MSKGNHSFTITVSNNKTEKEGVLYLVENYDGFFQVNKEEKREILKLLNLETRYLNSFDLIYIPDYAQKVISRDIIETRIEDILLLELKTTKKYLPNSPKGFFFGATENEFNFGKCVGEKFRFCFVCLHENSRSHAMVTLEELENLIKNRRVQYQINL